MKGLTPRQRELLSFIEDSIRTNGFSPSYREIMLHFGFRSVGSIHKHIQVLKRKGALTSEHGTSRSLMPANDPITNKFSNEITVPFIGHIEAGNPIEMFTHSKTLSVPEYLVPDSKKTYVLQSKGNSLNEELIADGDFLIIVARQEANAGDTVIALINHHDTIIKKYYPEPPYVHLAGNNPHHKPIILRQENIKIQGVITGILRLFSHS
jgi:repressor LexA